MKDITVSMRIYLRTIYELSPDNKGTRIIEISKMLGYTKASACRAISLLIQRNLIYRDTDKYVYLSQEGKVLATKEYEKLQTLQCFFQDIIGIQPIIAKVDAYALGANFSDIAISSMDKVYKRNTKADLCLAESIKL